MHTPKRAADRQAHDPSAGHGVSQSKRCNSTLIRNLAADGMTSEGTAESDSPSPATLSLGSRESERLR